MTAARSRTRKLKSAPKRPYPEQFSNYKAYANALATWKMKQDIALALSWAKRVKVSKRLHTDFEQVALQAPTTIPQGSLVDAWILQHRSGAEVLYALQKSQATLRRILALSPIAQIQALERLSQRLSSKCKRVHTKKRLKRRRA